MVDVTDRSDVHMWLRPLELLFSHLGILLAGFQAMPYIF
jgi:hypothetical protein